MKYLIPFCLFVFATTHCFGGKFTPGNLVIIRTGNGSSSLSSSATASYLVEYTTAGKYVQVINIPAVTSGNNHACTMSGTATTEGQLTLSPNGKYLTFCGFDTTAGFAKVSTSFTGKTIAIVDSSGTINTSTGYLPNTAYAGANFRAAATNDGTGFWTGGAANTDTTNGGIYYIPAGSFSGGTQLTYDITSDRNVEIFNGQLYFASSAGTAPGIFSFGSSGLPTSGTQSSILLPIDSPNTFPASPFGFWFFDEDSTIPGYDVLYVCDNSAGLYKYSLVGGSWVSNGFISSSAGLEGLTAIKTCTGVSMYISSLNEIYSITDNSGYNATITGKLTGILAAGSNEIFRGIAFTPGTTESPLTAAITAVDSVTCNGLNNGSITFTASGGFGAYKYNWNDGITTQNRNSLAPGAYTVTVTDGGGCSASATTTIYQPAVLSATSTVTNNVTCNGGNNGAATVQVSGGTPGYTFNWGNNITDQNPDTLSAGDYTVTVTDVHSCTATATDTVTQPDPIVVTDSVTNLPCTGGNTGAVTLTVTGGAGSYTYYWSNEATTQNITGLSLAGTYKVTVTDTNNCTAYDSAHLSQSGSLTISDTVTTLKCSTDSNGAINVSADGGTPGYHYLWSNMDTVNDLAGLTPGSYTLTVTDAGGCTLVNTFNLQAPPALNVSATITGVSCYGDSNGAVSIVVSGGVTPYTYLWNNLATSASLDSLKHGIYTLVVTDSNNCPATSIDTVDQPQPLAISPDVTGTSTAASSDGSITLKLVGGTPNYTYDWSNGSATDGLTGIPDGYYCVTVTDMNNCIVTSCDSVNVLSGIAAMEWIENFNAYISAGDLYINASLNYETTCMVQVFDLTGRAIINNAPTTTSELKMEIPLGGISPGGYLVRLVTDRGALSRKIIISR